MNDDSIYTLNITALDKIYSALKGEKLKAKVGILGNKNHRTDGFSNAQIGLAHEFGIPERNLPQRSFLIMPLTSRLNKELEKSGMFHEEMIKEVVKTGDLRKYVEKIGIAGVSVVLEAFNTQGFGTWQELKPRTIESKKSQGFPLDILIATHQLRDSISYEVK